MALSELAKLTEGLEERHEKWVGEVQNFDRSVSKAPDRVAVEEFIPSTMVRRPWRVASA